MGFQVSVFGRSWRRSDKRFESAPGHHSRSCGCFASFPAPHARMGPVACPLGAHNGQQLTQCCRSARRARIGRRSGRNQVTRGSTCGVHLVHELLSAMADSPNYPGASGSTAYSFRKCRDYLQRTAREAPRHTPPSRRSRVRLHSEKCSRSRVVTSSAAASDDAVHAVRC
jgi:hypothetical protein